MKICVYGAGAVGGHIAGRLAAGQTEVSVIERGEQLDVILESMGSASRPVSEYSCRTRSSPTNQAISSPRTSSSSR